MQGCAMNITKKKIKEKMTASNFFVLKKVKFDRGFQKLIETYQDQTSGIKASYNKGIHTMYSNKSGMKISKNWA